MSAKTLPKLSENEGGALSRARHGCNGHGQAPFGAMPYIIVRNGTACQVSGFPSRQSFHDDCDGGRADQGAFW